MHPTETEKAQPWIARVVHHGDYNPNGDSYGYIQTEKAAIDVIVPPNMKDEFPALLERIASCVNACASIPDPASTVPALVAALEGLLPLAESGRVHHGKFEDTQSIMDQARAALALAQGGKR